MTKSFYLAGKPALAGQSKKYLPFKPASIDKPEYCWLVRRGRA